MENELKVGDKYGCLEIIGDCKEAENDLQETFSQWAESEWNEYLYDGEMNFSDVDFKSYYSLNTNELKSYENKEAMPKSFVEKYRKVGDFYGCRISQNKRFLWHKSQPNTRYSLEKAYREKKLYKVKCNVCGRILYTDETSLGCVKWKYCIGSECIATTIDNSEVDYTKSLYEWDDTKNELQALNTQLALAEELSIPLTYYSKGSKRNSLEIAYISDIHLMHHLKYYEDDEKKMIKDIVEHLYQTGKFAEIEIFCGDIASSLEMIEAFFKQYKLRYNYQPYKVYKERLNRCKRKKEIITADKQSKYAKQLDKISKYIEKKQEKVKKSFDFVAFERYKKIYHPDIGYEEAYEYYKKTKGFKKNKVTKRTEQKILEILVLQNRKAEYISHIEQGKSALESARLEIENWEKEYSKPVEEITLNDYSVEPLKNVYYVLGNHEYIEFPNIETGVEVYKEYLAKLGVVVLQNEWVENDKYLLYGGTGFAKYDEKYNANTIVCSPGLTREEEIKETTKFEDGYKKALAYAKEKGLCFVCATHYPVNACLNGAYDKEAIYFTGHNHRNEYVKKEDKVLYADNQIGYYNNDIAFKTATTGYEINPYAGLADGLYNTTVEDYLKFYRYVGENVGEGNLLYQRCQKGKMYLVKRKGYYGFFIVSTNKNSKGISIVNGGKTKKLTTSTDISWICENFDIVVSKYLQMLLPLRRAQDELSKELKELGLYGTIHGLIVDIDFYHHIAINPMNGTMQFYYSSIWGMEMDLNSFDEVIQSLEYHKSSWDNTDYKLIQAKYIEKSQNNGYLLSITSNNYLLESETYEVDDISQRMEQVVSRTDGMYEVSRKISPLQRLFTGRVLRDFDLRLTETKQQAPHRKNLYTGRVFNYEGIRYQIVEDDGSDIIVAEELQKGSMTKGKDIVLSGKRKKFAIENLKAKIKKYEAYWYNE